MSLLVELWFDCCFGSGVEIFQGEVLAADLFQHVAETAQNAGFAGPVGGTGCADEVRAEVGDVGGGGGEFVQLLAGC
jgi:hypothetical protein